MLLFINQNKTKQTKQQEECFGRPLPAVTYFVAETYNGG
jgi:hypothetical protein